jgi:hypothetical protein
VIDHDTTWSAHDAPYIIKEGFIVENATDSAVLTIDAGAKLMMAKERRIVVGTNGGLTLDGTEDNHVVITSAEKIPAAGDWDRIIIDDDSQSNQNRFNNADISYGNRAGNRGQLAILAGAVCTINNVVFTNGGNCDISASGTLTKQGTNAYLSCP